MPKKLSSEPPRTAGELRRLIAENQYSWTVDPRLRDTDSLPKRPRGGKSAKELPAGTVTLNNVADYLRKQQAPANPFLRERWSELKLLERKSGNFPAGSSPQLPPSAKQQAKPKRKSQEKKP